jgi:hypothetical protein
MAPAVISVSAPPQRISRQKLKLTQFVAAHRKRGHIITLDKDFAAKVIGQARQIFQRRRRANQFQTREKG